MISRTIKWVLIHPNYSVNNRNRLLIILICVYILPNIISWTVLTIKIGNFMCRAKNTTLSKKPKLATIQIWIIPGSLVTTQEHWQKPFSMYFYHTQNKRNYFRFWPQSWAHLLRKIPKYGCWSKSKFWYFKWSRCAFYHSKTVPKTISQCIFTIHKNRRNF